MFERLRNLWRTINPPAEENAPVAEPVDARPRWRKKRKYKSRRESDRAYRERQRQKTDATKEITSTERVTPEIIPILSASVEASSLASQLETSDMPWSEHTTPVEPSNLLLNGLRSLIHPGSAATPPVVEKKPVELFTDAEPPVFDAHAKASESLKAAQTIEPTPASREWQPDWMEESRVDLPMRDSAHIARLLKFETAEQTRARIQNDQARYLYSRRGAPAPDMQSAIVNPNFKFPAITTFVKR
jgi:hypothetical protein